MQLLVYYNKKFKKVKSFRKMPFFPELSEELCKSYYVNPIPISPGFSCHFPTDFVTKVTFVYITGRIM